MSTGGDDEGARRARKRVYTQTTTPGIRELSLTPPPPAEPRKHLRTKPWTDAELVELGAFDQEADRVAWLAARLNVIGGSECARVCGHNPWESRRDFVYQHSHFARPGRPMGAYGRTCCAHGTATEPRARALHMAAADLNVVASVEVGIVVHADVPYAGASLDGEITLSQPDEIVAATFDALGTPIGDAGLHGNLEIKSPVNGVYDYIPLYYLIQVLYQLACANSRARVAGTPHRYFSDFCVYYEPNDVWRHPESRKRRAPPKRARMKVWRIYANEAVQAQIMAGVREVGKMLLRDAETPLTHADIAALPEQAPIDLDRVRTRVVYENTWK